MTEPRRKVVVCSTHAYWPSHLERDMELIQQHLDAGDQVTRLVCQTDFDRCDEHLHPGPNPSREVIRDACENCIDRLKRSQQLIEGDCANVRYQDLPGWKGFTAPRIGPFNDIKELQAFEWNGFDAGLAVGASLISIVRVTRPDILPYREVIERLLTSSLRLYSSFRAYLAAERPDMVYVLNGRFTHVRALFRACQQEGVRCMIHEMGSQIDRYMLLDNVMPHDRTDFARRVRALWAERGQDPKAREQATKWYEDRARGVDQGWFSYVKHHDPSLLPEGWNPSRPKIVVFTSSEDEFAAIGPDWKNPLFTTQRAGLTVLRDLVAELRPDADLVIRVHPNLSGSTDQEVTSIPELAGPAVIVVAPESRVSSYGLLQAAELVLTFGSSMGMEAVFWGKPSILLGPTMYDGLGGLYRPMSIEELRTMLSTKLEPLDREVPLMFGYYVASFGELYRYYEPASLLRGRYRGIDLDTQQRTLVFRVRAGIREGIRGGIRRGLRRGVRATVIAVVGASFAGKMLQLYRRMRDT